MIFETMYDQSDIEWAISSEKRSKKMTDLKEMEDRILQPGSEISLSDVANELPSAGVAQDKIRLDIDQFREQLAFSINNHDIVLEKQVFPKRKRPSDINISVTGKQDLQWSLESRNSAASIVSFVREFTAWIPTYIQVEEEIRVKEKQKSIACQMATTMLEENVGCVLKEKGYSFRIISRRDNATIYVKISDSVDFNIKVNLLSDFLADVQSLVEQLKPNKTAE